MEIRKAAVIVREAENQLEGLRSCLGMGVEMIEAHYYVIGKLQIPGDRAGDFQESLELLDDLDGRAFTDTRSNLDNYEIFEFLPVDEMGPRLAKYDLVIPF